MTKCLMCIFVYLSNIFESKNKENNYSRRENCVHTVIYNFGAPRRVLIFIIWSITAALSTTTFQINLMSLILTANAENIFCFRLNFRVLTLIVDGNYREDKIFIFNTLQLIFTSIISVLKMAFGHSDSHTALSSNYCFSQKSAWNQTEVNYLYTLYS